MQDRPFSRGGTAQLYHGDRNFRFSRRIQAFDWRLLHGINIEHLVKTADVDILQQILPELQNGNLELERDVPINSCVVVFRLCQLALNWLKHLYHAHITQAEMCNLVIEAAGRYKHTAQQYVEYGLAFVHEAQAIRKYDPEALAAVQQLKDQLELEHQKYTIALDHFEAEEAKGAMFRFNRQPAQIDWRQVYSIHIEDVVNRSDVPALQGILPTLERGSILLDDPDTLTQAHFNQLLPLAQCLLDYYWHHANASGVALVSRERRVRVTLGDVQEDALHAQHAALSDVPQLTTSAEDVTEAITKLLTPPPVVHMPPPPPPPQPPHMFVTPPQTPDYHHVQQQQQQQPPQPQQQPPPQAPPPAPVQSSPDLSNVKEKMDNFEKSLQEEKQLMQKLQQLVTEIYNKVNQPPPANPPLPPTPKTPGGGNTKIKLIFDEGSARRAQLQETHRKVKMHSEMLKEAALREHLASRGGRPGTAAYSQY